MVVTAPENYSNLINVMFTDNMTSWDFVANIKNVYTTYVPESIFWLVILVLPYMMMYNRQNGILIIAILYLFTGSFTVLILPSFLAPFAFWFILLGVSGIVYRLFVSE